MKPTALELKMGRARAGKWLQDKRDKDIHCRNCGKPLEEYEHGQCAECGAVTSKAVENWLR